MNRMSKMASAAVASFILVTGASAASAASFNQPAGTAVTARGQLIQYVNVPGVVETTCNVAIHGVVDANGSTITFNSYEGAKAAGNPGNLACDESLTFPIVATPSAGQISLDVFEVGTRGGPCIEEDYALSYSGNTANFNGQYFGNPPICRASGSLALTTDVGNNPVLIQ